MTKEREFFSVISDALGIDRSITTLPKGVRSIRWRRASPGSFRVLTRLRFFKRSITPFILAASIAIKRPNSFCDNEPYSYNFAKAENLVGVKSFGIKFEKILACS